MPARLSFSVPVLLELFGRAARKTDEVVGRSSSLAIDRNWLVRTRATTYYALVAAAPDRPLAPAVYLQSGYRHRLNDVDRTRQLQCGTISATRDSMTAVRARRATVVSSCGQADEPRLRCADPGIGTTRKNAD